MQSLQPKYIGGSSVGLENDEKPLFLPEQAYVKLENAYVWRNRTIKRQGLSKIGRLTRVLTAQNLGNTDGSGNFTGNIISILTLEANSQIQSGSISITVGAQVFVEADPPDGTLTNGGAGTGTINYATGDLTLNTDPNLAATAVLIDFSYFPMLPVMGIWQREISGINREQTFFWDTKYSYIFQAGAFQQFDTTTWTSDDAHFFWTANFRGTNPYNRAFFSTNFFNNPAGPTGNPIRYITTGNWTDFDPLISSTETMYQARILIPYYGRLLALNTWEGNTGARPAALAATNNFFARCRFSQIGDPLQADAWRTDIFGKGGFIDAPVNEEIITAAFFKNTLIVGFERSIWQLRYVGEYGLPFLWERISSDYGCESTFSDILFDKGVLLVGDKAIVSSSGVSAERIDSKIPDTIFEFRNSNDGKERVIGIRDYQNELVYWSYVDPFIQQSQTTYKYPNKTLVFNYLNNSFAKFRDSTTFFGTLQRESDVTWDSLTTIWDDQSVLWTDADSIRDFPLIVSGNQQGYIHSYNDSSFDEPSLAITDIDTSVTPLRVTVPAHNLFNGEWVYLTNAIMDPVVDNLNGRIYNVLVIDENTVDLFVWDETAFASANFTADVSTYLGDGELTLLPVLEIESKDFNPFTEAGMQFKISFIDFLFDAFPLGQVTVELYINSSPTAIANMLVGNNSVSMSLRYFGAITSVTQDNPCVITSENHSLKTGDQIYITDVLGMTELNLNTYTVTYIDENTFSINTDSTLFSDYISGGNWIALNDNFYIPDSEYAWQRFFATANGQFIRYKLTYSNDLMANLVTHRNNLTLNAVRLWVRPGGRNVI